MAPGPDFTGGNRFSLLADSPKAKKKRKEREKITFEFPDLPQTFKENPKFVVLAAVDSGKNLAQYSCFLVHKAILAISKEITSISALRDGTILLLVKNNTIAQRFLKTTTLPGVCKIACKLHNTLNHVKGTVYAPCLNNVDEEEIVSELSSQGVVGAYKFQKVSDGKAYPCGVVLLTFDRYNLPSKIDICWHNVKVREYIPNPMRCKSCQILGHTAKHCKNSPSCVICNLPPHSPEKCTRVSCANCQEQHPASSKECKKFQQEKEILKIKTTTKCTMREARRLATNSVHSNSVTPTYSSITAQQTNTQSALTPSEQTTNNQLSPEIQQNNQTPSNNHALHSIDSTNTQSISNNTNYTALQGKTQTNNNYNNNETTPFSLNNQTNYLNFPSPSGFTHASTRVNKQTEVQNYSCSTEQNALPTTSTSYNYSNNINTNFSEVTDTYAPLTTLPTELQHLPQFLSQLSSSQYDEFEEQNSSSLK
ncbi:uncharacterized protein DDB_G0281497-like [Anastrepha ludens]|uniref:uncharacterized protein DDB_G0281497-like n=1 Tax=Anastrepha ludens TaxID=28586 RepID=UPI0023AF1032|nr:uncharacterized protein DDB_G0281497-like [Anastrepha ludens]